MNLDNSGDWQVVDGLVSGDLQRQTTVKDSSGGPLQTWALMTAGVPCDIQPASAAVKERFGQLANVRMYTIYLSQQVGARASDRWVLSDGSRTFSIVEGDAEAGYDVLTGFPETLHVIEVPSTP